MKIKSLLAILAISIAFCATAQTQEPEETRHEIAISYGTVPNSMWIDILTDVIPAMFGEDYEDYKCVGPIGLEYFYHTSPLIGVGAVAVFATNNEDGYYDKALSSHINRTYFTFMPSVKFNWLRKKNWGLYSKLALGTTYTHFVNKDYDEQGHKSDEKITANDLLFNFQVSLLGFEAGGNHVRGFLELGMGEQGVALAGVRYKF